MHSLILVGRSDDNKNIILSDHDGNEFTVAIDDYLVRSVAAPKPTNDQQPIGVSPRDIQSRIRRGESAADIAAEAGTSIERIERYAGPVYTERWHMAQRARDTTIRRVSGEEPLDGLVVASLIQRNVDSTAADWDSFRREDNRWNVTVKWPEGPGFLSATWIFDPVGQTLVPLDEEARWLLEENSVRPAQEPPARPRLVRVETGTVMPEPAPYEVDDGLDVPAWAGPGQPTMPVSLDEPSWDDILFGALPNDE